MQKGQIFFSRDERRTCLLASLLACRGLVEGVGLLSGLVSAIRRAEVLRHAGQYRELSTPVGTAGNDPSQTWHRVRHYWNLTPALAATQHRPRLLAPARQLVCRRDQRLLPRQAFNQIAPASHRSGTAVRSERIHPGGNYKPGIPPSAWHTAPLDVSLFAVTTPAYTSPPWARFAAVTTPACSLACLLAEDLSKD